MEGLALTLGILHETDRGPLTVVAGLGGGLSSSLGDPEGNSKDSNLDMIMIQTVFSKYIITQRYVTV